MKNRTSQGAMILVIMCIFTLSACSLSPQETREGWQQRIDQLENANDSLETSIFEIRATIDEQRATIQALPDGTVKDQIQSGIARAETLMAEMLQRQGAIGASIDSGRAALDALPENAESWQINGVGAGQTVSGIGAVLPPPWGTVLGGIGALIAGVSLRSSKKNKGAAIGAIDTLNMVKESSSEAAAFLNTNRSVIRRAQGVSAGHIDKLRGR